MPNYLFILLFCFVIYGNLPCNANNGEIPYRGLKPKCKPRDVNINGSCVGVATYDNSYLIQNDFIGFSGSRVSENGKFKLGFFNRRGGNIAYLGIWYNTNTTTNPDSEMMVWVANRDTPISPQQQRSCSLVVAKDGIAKLLDPNNHSLWSSNSPKSYGVTVLQLSDTGNLILTDRTIRKTLWESFQNPTDTILQDQWRYFNTSVNLTSWITPDDPARGSSSFQRVNSADYNLSITRTDNPSIPYWMGKLSDLPPLLTSFLDGTTNNSLSLRLYLDPEGSIHLLQHHPRGPKSTKLWTAPTDQCDLYEKKCGSFGVCDAANGFKCKCLPGFTAPAGSGESTDCTRSDTCSVSDEFLRLPMVNIPPHPLPSRSLTDEICKKNCLGADDCECKAYSYDPVHSNCLIWTQSLTGLQQEFYRPSNTTLYVRVSQSDIVLLLGGQIMVRARAAFVGLT